jgi:hypothetical protein
MRQWAPWLVLSLGAVVTLAGCGGTRSYALAPTKACLKKQPGLKLRSKVDFVASTAFGGAVRVLLDRRNEVTISFGRTEEDALNVASGYRRVHGKNIGIEDVLRPVKNAVLLWRAHPSDQDISTIDHCLK